jgi:diguanylate cyclase (GGDEF)-like protein/PAS domain S-box-containing protein
MKSINEELLGIAYDNLRLSSLALIASVTVLFVVLYGHVQSTILGTWYFLIVAVSIFRFITHKAYKKNREKLTYRQWKVIFYAGAFVTAILLGITPSIFFVADEPVYQMMLLIILAGITAGGTASLASMEGVLQFYLTVILVPLMLQMIWQDTLVYHTLAFLIFSYLVVLFSSAKIFYKNYLDAVITKKMYKEENEKLLLSQERFGAVFKQAPLGIFTYDKNLVIQEANEEFLEFLEAPRDSLIGLDLHQLPDDRVFSAISVITQGIEGFYEGEYTTKYKKKDLWITLHSSPLMDKDGSVIGGIGIVADITQRMLTQIKFEHQAKHDTLTNIPNRIFLLEKITVEISRYKRHGRLFAVLFLDLDHFKNINDSLGHGVGDEVLVKISQRFSMVLREEDTLARLGGDEFVVLLPDLDSDENSAAMKAEAIAQKIHATLMSPVAIKQHVLNISSSIGVALIGDKESVEDVIKHADIAMYEAKNAGRNTTKFYKAKMDEWISRRVQIENGLRSALKNDEFEIYYQAIVEFATCNIIGAEALLRWNTKEIENVYPDEFIPIAEESGLIFEIGAWVLKNALKQFVAWQEKLKNSVSLEKIAVNISAYQFGNSRCIDQIGMVIQESEIKPECLDLELVESALVANTDNVRSKMQELRDLGVGISIDDFGTGYSSLSYLKKLPFTKLKIDKSFTMDIQDDIDDKELISAILAIAETFNFKVVAEGVETLEQYQFLKERNCQYMQGYLCSKPLPASAFEELLRRHDGKCTLGNT